MAKELHYKLQFPARDEKVWRIEIWQETTGQNTTVWPEDVMLSLDGDSPLTIDWPETRRYEPICGSAATLCLHCDSDRRFIGLCSSDPGAVRLDIFCDNVAVWSGMLDPEIWEEPYEWQEGYEVTLTFSDFGILDRRVFNLSGVCAIRQIMQAAITQAGIMPGTIDDSLIAAKYNGQSLLDSLAVRADNFADEEGNAMTYKQVLKDLLLPLGLRMVQQYGKVYIYDIAGLQQQESRQIRWCDDQQTMNVGPVYNNVTLTFSPMADGSVYDGTIEAKEVLKNASTVRWYTDNGDGGSELIPGFDLAHGAAPSDLPIEVATGMSLFRIFPVYSGEDCAGVVGFASKLGTTIVGSRPVDPVGRVGNTNIPNYSNSNYTAINPVLNTRPAYCVGDTSRFADYNLRIRLDLLFDVRYNPFEPAAKRNEEGNYKRMQDWCNFAYIPVKLELLDETGNVVSHYNNSAVMRSNSYTGVSNWQAGPATWGEMWLAYYDRSNRKSASGLGGWATNRQCIGYFRDELPELWGKRGDGEFIPMPSQPGYLRLTVGSGLHWFDYNREADGNKNLLSRATFMMYRNPKIDVVTSVGKDLTAEDVVWEGVADPQAKEDLPLGSSVGTLPKNLQLLPTAKGAILDASTLIPIEKITRSGRTTAPEEHLMDIIFSGHGDRHTVLSGAADLVLSAPSPLTEAMQGDSLFLMVAETMDCYNSTTEVMIEEIGSDSWHKN